MRQAELWELLANAEVNHRELDLSFFVLARADVFRFQVTVRTADTVQNFKRQDDLSKHVCGEVDTTSWPLDVAPPFLETVATVSH